MIMKRRDFFRNGSLLTAGSMVINPFDTRANAIKEEYKHKKAKNIIFLVSDGMSAGTLAMADQLLRRKQGRASHWISLYENQLVQRAIMDMASASSLVTDSAAASSSWGGGVRVKNGRINVSHGGKHNMPILQKFKKAGKKVGCVTTVPIAHATPAGFTISIKSRNSMDKIVELYAENDFDVMMGGGSDNFDPAKRKDGKDMFSVFKQKGYTVARNKSEMNTAKANKPLVGVFDTGGLNYNLDHINDSALKASTPTLAEMTSKAIAQLKNNNEGFVLMVEAGKVDWAAHANDIGGLLYDQIAFDDCVKVAMDFAKKDEETLVIVTTDHGNANPGLVYGKKADQNFENIQHFTSTNDKVLQGINASDSVEAVKEKVAQAFNKWSISSEQAKNLLSYYQGTKKVDGLYNYKKLPYKYFAEIQEEWTSVGWNSMNHTSDYVELASYGPGSELIKPFMLNTDMHYFLLKAAHVENKF